MYFDSLHIVLLSMSTQKLDQTFNDCFVISKADHADFNRTLLIREQIIEMFQELVQFRNDHLGNNPTGVLLWTTGSGLIQLPCLQLFRLAIHIRPILPL